MTDQRNLILAIVLSVGIILAFQFLYEAPRIQEQQEQAERQRTSQQEGARQPAGDAGSVTPQPGTGETATGDAPPAPRQASPLGQGIDPGEGIVSREQALADEPRVRIDNFRLHGSLALEGARFDDLTLADYHETVDPTSPEIPLLNPVGASDPYFAEFGWVPGSGDVAVPTAETLWRANDQEIEAGDQVTLNWSNGSGLEFQRRVSLDDGYMFTLERSVTNTADEPVTLYPYSLISRWGTPETSGFYILHEGPIGVFDDTLTEKNYNNLQDEGTIEQPSDGGWIGFSDKYWLTALIPDQSRDLTANFRYTERNGLPRYQVDFLGQPRTIQPGQTVTVTDHMFAGAKELDKLDGYAAQYDIPLFDRAVNFGWFYFLTKPLFQLLNFFERLVGNYGVAILLLTLAVKLVFFPLANKSYRAMSAMKKLQPEMTKLRERYSDDKQKMQQELMALYKREKVNPMAGCLPILIQIPVFFALYKVLFVSIEMRHAPFFGWVQDLSAPDPTSIFNLFGILPFDPPGFLMLGVWPLLMGISMWLQQKLNPQPADPMQARIMMMLPIMFVFLFATFPAGLVIYWTWNNVLSIAQQWLIMRRMGVPAT